MCLELINWTIGFVVLLKTDRHLMDSSVIQLKALFRFGEPESHTRVSNRNDEEAKAVCPESPVGE